VTESGKVLGIDGVGVNDRGEDNNDEEEGDEELTTDDDTLNTQSFS
jgi:hypothetical protein